MKYHALLTADDGLNHPAVNPCKLLDYGLLELAAGKSHTAESNDREILAVILGGKATFEINGQRFEKVGGRPNVFSGKPYSVVANGIWGAANFKRNFHQTLTLTSQPDLPARRLIVGETFTPSGNWSTYPPHKH